MLGQNLHVEAKMRNQQSRGMVSQSNEFVAPRSQSCQMSRARPLSQLASLVLLTIWVVLTGFTARAQDSAKQQAADSKEVSGFLGDYSGSLPIRRMATCFSTRRTETP